MCEYSTDPILYMYILMVHGKDMNTEHRQTQFRLKIPASLPQIIGPKLPNKF